ncbi:MAG: hypothetical protein Q4F84_05905, partial [Fibrobacter sp.]|nr:hypothetical protein [Fibrobacter sp.]
DLRSLQPGGYFNVTLPYSDGDVDTVIYTDNNQVFSPGAILLGKEGAMFPEDAKNRWYEPVFKSTDPESPNFLVPDWDDSLMYEFVVDQGDPTTGILDADGSIADLGAIPFHGDLSKDKIIITPTQPAFINGTKARISFRVHAIEGDMTDPEIKYIRWVHNIPDNTNSWGTGAKPIPASGIVVPTGDLGIEMGSNTLNLTIPAMAAVDSISFFEMVVEGTGSNGKKVTSTVGFVPYRQLQYKFVIEVYDVSGKTKLESVVVGEPVLMKIKPERIDGAPMKDVSVDYVELALGSIEYKLKDEKGKDLSFLTGVPTSGKDTVVMFTRIPDGGMEMITATGMFDTTNSANNEAIAGASDPIKILPGKPAQIKFQDPPSGNKARPSVIQRGGACREVTLYVFDKYGNKTIEPANVSIKSQDKSKGDFTCDTEKKSDENGEVVFECLTVIDGEKDDVFSIEAKLDADTDVYDTAWLKLGNITDMFVIYYDTVELNSDTMVEIDACSIERVPVIIRAMANKNMVTTRQTKFQITFDKSGLAAYSSDTAKDPITEYALVDGEAVIWLQSNVQLVENGKIQITPIGDRSIMSNQRTGINFKYCENPVKVAYYYADNGNGAVNKIEVHFSEPINKESMPDTLVFYWPDRNAANGKRVVTKEGMKIDSKDPSVVNITLDNPFDKFITVATSSADSLLGDCISYSKEMNFVFVKKFPVKEKVGPLLMGAVLMERLVENGDDTLYLTFSEPIPEDAKSLVANGLNLIKGGEQITLDVLNAKYISKDTVLAIVKNAGSSSPKEGDSLCLNPKSSVKDMAGNSVHEKNRPVVIMQRDVPPDILEALYYDKDGNGIVDRIVAEFNKKIKLEKITAVDFVWGDKKIGNIKSTQISFYEENETKIEIKVNSNFKDVGVKTSGTMRLTLKYDGAKTDRVADVKDKAAPVISKAVYCPGAVVEKDELPDTFLVTFS